MRILQRYLLRELLVNALFTFLVLSFFIVMIVFSIAALKSSLVALSISALLEVVALQAATRLDVLLPLTVLVSCIWTYGRARGAGEVTAMRGAGVRLYHILIPAIVLGSMVTALLAWLQDEIIPNGHYHQLVIGKRHLAASIEALLKDDSRHIQDRRFKVTWDRLEVDENGYNVIRDVVVAERKSPEAPPIVTRAKTAVPILNKARGELTLTLEDIVYGETMAARELTITLDLKALSEEPMPSRRIENRTYEELLTDGRRHAGERAGRKGITEFHRRTSTAFSATLYGLLGALLGLVLKVTNRAWVFTIGFFVVLALSYGPTLALIPPSVSGAVPPLALWTGNGLIATLSVCVFVGAFRR